MMKHIYQVPLVEEILIADWLEDPFCGASIGDYTGQHDDYDSDSD